MPTLRESSMYPRNNLAPAQPGTGGFGGMPSGPVMSGPVGISTILPVNGGDRSTLMHASMPVIAATYDSVVRQFYGNPRVPVTRILPPRTII